jgi:hypothetical protein
LLWHGPGFTIVAMAHFKFMLDRGVSHLLDCFPTKRVVSTETLGLRSNLSDDEILTYASERGYLIVASNRRDFLLYAKRHVAQSSKKQFGCCRIPGMILLVPNEEIAQRRVLKGIESRLRFNGKAISFTDVHDQDLLVSVEATGRVSVSRLPRCPHCTHYTD